MPTLKWTPVEADPAATSPPAPLLTEPAARGAHRGKKVNGTSEENLRNVLYKEGSPYSTGVASVAALDAARMSVVAGPVASFALSPAVVMSGAAKSLFSLAHPGGHDSTAFNPDYFSCSRICCWRG